MSIFNEILDLRSKDVKKLAALPPGTYLATVVGLPTYEAVGAKQTPAAKFLMTGFIPQDCVDREKLAECGDVVRRELTLTMFLTGPSLWRLKKLLDDLGIEEGNRTFKQRIDDVPNRQCLVHVKNTMPKDTIFAEIDQTAKLP
jgi:hypothetical protein